MRRKRREPFRPGVRPPIYSALLRRALLAEDIVRGSGALRHDFGGIDTAPRLAFSSYRHRGGGTKDALEVLPHQVRTAIERNLARGAPARRPRVPTASAWRSAWTRSAVNKMLDVIEKEIDLVILPSFVLRRGEATRSSRPRGQEPSTWLPMHCVPSPGRCWEGSSASASATSASSSHQAENSRPACQPSSPSSSPRGRRSSITS